MTGDTPPQSLIPAATIASSASGIRLGGAWRFCSPPSTRRAPGILSRTAGHARSRSNAPLASFTMPRKSTVGGPPESAARHGGTCTGLGITSTSRSLSMKLSDWREASDNDTTALARRSSQRTKRCAGGEQRSR